MKPPRPAGSSRIVYSTATGRICPGCVRPVAECVCKRAGTSRHPAGSAVRVGRETKGRAGKGVTVIAGLGLAPAELEALARALKQRCGSGGTVRDGVIEIQGEHRDTVLAELARRGIEAKRSGG
jgi:translation initiation factor 1